MRRHGGWTLIVKYAEAGIDPERATADLDKFMAAWKAYTIPLLANKNGGGAA